MVTREGPYAFYLTNVPDLMFPQSGNTTQRFHAIARYERDPFGTLLSATGPAASVCPFGFQTKYYDQETGLVYYGHRWYEPPIGRWLSRDPIEEEGGNNLSVFCANNPVNRRDPLGLQAEWFPTGPDVPNGAIFSYRFDPAPVNAAIADTVGKVWASPASGIQRVSPLNSE